ncbi:hypothetical protein [Staphylococcus epidermidis]|uniref:hypothetical protein n=1 Tax=Staphylococcus epidermidis TaxID=1282 RepID=UPI00035527FA|nr:hypothetical protein [Staphylococcus epidermidis]EPP67817.1 hypothetical protein M458_07500 [Staphylococcus epidermidis Scl22]ESR04258.1 hypothetical protein M462_0211880 [Staphylococcus epidermidis CIM28]ESR27903.1 hypothetical protein M452_0201490 [Staphylococcus epidermidis APO35]EST94989.1 hypothetical protein M460_0203510 [Staphylococcus epidermidis Scl31]ESU03168.1 hypothetical protein M461_0210225 [Staphylococcus epidermidis CIM37]
MKKILILISILLIVGTACSCGPTKQAQGKWQNSNGDTINVKGEKFKVTMKGSTIEGDIKDDKDHKDLSKVKIVGETAYIKVDDDTLSITEEPGDTPNDEAQFTKVK